MAGRPEKSEDVGEQRQNMVKPGKTVGFNPSIVTQLAPPRCSSVRWCRSSAFEELSGQQSKAWDGMGTKLDIEFLGTFL